MIEKTFFIHNNLNQRLSVKLSEPEKFNNDIVIFSHGLFSSKDGYKINRLKNLFLELGILLVLFDFSFSGESEGDIFDISLIQELEDLRSVLFYFKSKYPASKFHFMGSSFGSAISLLLAQEIDCESLVLIASPANLKELILSLNIKELNGNKISIDGVETNKKFLLELKNIDLIKNIDKIDSPVLLLHGEDDAIVPVAHSKKLDANLKKSKLFIISNGNHNLVKDKEIDIMRKEIKIWLEGKYKDV